MYGGPIGRAMRLFLRDDLYATTHNFYATVANLDALVTTLDAIVLVYSAVAEPLHAHVYHMKRASIKITECDTCDLSF